MLFEPNATLYVKNVDWKVKKPLLKRALYSLFTRHGKVLEVIVLRRQGLRGQAWVIFEDAAASTAAMQAEQGFSFFGKDLVLEYAKEKSDRIAKRDGSYIPKAKRQKKVVDPKEEEEAEAEGEGKEEKPASDGQESNQESNQEEVNNPPSKYLLAQNLPAECNQMMLGMLFRQYAGYKEVRLPRPGLAFVEFVDIPHATLAKKGLDGFKLTTNDTLRLDYGKS
jgi:U2 small nuclear ribonucleoprotein B''